MSELGFKTLTQQNFLERDPTLQAFFAGLTQTDLMDDVFGARLSARVPDDVKALFEGARGAMCYGFYFYPLFMLGADQLCRVAETAVRHRVKQLAGPSDIRFSDGIKFLVERGAIPEGQSGAWDAVRRLRNETSHPRFQQQIPPGVGVGMLHRVNELIDALFAG